MAKPIMLRLIAGLSGIALLTGCGFTFDAAESERTVSRDQRASGSADVLEDGMFTEDEITLERRQTDDDDQIIEEVITVDPDRADPRSPQAATPDQEPDQVVPFLVVDPPAHLTATVEYDDRRVRFIREYGYYAFDEFHYDDQKRLVRVNDERPSSWVFEYDEHNRIVKKTYVGKERDIITQYAYDEHDRLIEMKDFRSTTTWEYRDQFVIKTSGIFQWVYDLEAKTLSHFKSDVLEAQQEYFFMAVNRFPGPYANALQAEFEGVFTDIPKVSGDETCEIIEQVYHCTSPQQVITYRLVLRKSSLGERYRFLMLKADPGIGTYAYNELWNITQWFGRKYTYDAAGENIVHIHTGRMQGLEYEYLDP